MTIQDAPSNDPLPLHAAENMRPPTAAQYLGISQSQLAKLRMEANRNKGPPFSKVAGCVIYRRADLDEWVNAHVVD